MRNQWLRDVKAPANVTCLSVFDWDLDPRGSEEAAVPVGPKWQCFHQALVNVSALTPPKGFLSHRPHPLPGGRRRKQREKKKPLQWSCCLPGWASTHTP